MNTTKMLRRTECLVLSAITAVLAGCTTYVEQPRVVQQEPPPPAYVPPPPEQAAVEVEIRSENDFYEPLAPYGRWQVVGAYGRCWIPTRVEADWRPYCNGHWQRTERGWYWVSDEPWGWAAYHYGRWDFSPQIGWYWVPQTQWAPAWVSWRRGGGYVGWAPLPPSTRFNGGGVIATEERNAPPRNCVFVEEKRFLEPVRPRTVVVNNTTIINQTVNITNIKVVNNTVINEGPRTEVIEKASGRPVRPVAVRELRHKTEAEVVAKQKVARPARANSVPAQPATNPVPSRDETGERDAQRRMDLEKQKQAEALKTAQDKAAQAQADRRADEAKKKAQMETDRRAQEAQATAKLEAERHTRELEKQKQGETLKAAQQKAAQAQVDRRAEEAQKKAQMQAARESEKRTGAETEKNDRKKQVQSAKDRRVQEGKLNAQHAAEVRTNENRAIKGKAAKKPDTKSGGKTVEEAQASKPSPDKPAQPQQP